MRRTGPVAVRTASSRRRCRRPTRPRSSRPTPRRRPTRYSTCSTVAASPVTSVPPCGSGSATPPMPPRPQKTPRPPGAGALPGLLPYDGAPVRFGRGRGDLGAEPAGPDEFRVHAPPGIRTVEETGNWVADEIAVLPGLAGTGARAAAEAVNRTVGAVSAARSFLNDLPGRR